MLQKKLDEVRVVFRLSLPKEGYMLLDEALLMEATLVEDIVEKSNLADVSSFDQQWWTVLVSLFRVGRCHIEGETENYPMWFYLWARKCYPHLTNWELLDDTIFGSELNESIFDNVRYVEIDY
ncbi:hypothetical protein [Methylorubrum extorquens]|uniref:Uncharacterized protein n=1 Tax=Methylorubrum extorquens TaxID=408 RepID=A0AAX3WFE9_METEX|nr:hypothetical protein [Methylorubrum extorquens]WHQ70193.1 hypothetical protein KEC54_00500 [Methylorubrum extorquens]